MAPIRVKLFGLISMTRRTYLVIQAVVLAFLLALMAVGIGTMVWAGAWLPRLEPPPQGGPPERWLLEQGLGSLFWLGLLTLVLEALETYFVLRKFAREEALDRAKRATLDTAPLGAAPHLADPHGVRPLPGIQPDPLPETGPPP